MKSCFRSLLLLLFLLSLLGCRTNPTFDFGTYSQAERFYEKKEYQKAISKYEEYLRENPEGNMAVISYYYMGKSFEGLGQVEEARELYKKIVKDYPHLVWADFAKTRLKELRLSTRLSKN